MSFTMTVQPEDLSPDEGHLAIRASKGDLNAAGLLAERYRRGLYLLALQLTGSKDDAMDLAQETLFRFFSKLHSYNPSKPLKPFLFRIVRNLSVDLFRKQKTRGWENQILDEPATGGLNPEDALTLQEKQKKLWQAVNSLKPIYREILIFRDYQDLSYAEIADALGIASGTVMSRLNKARTLLRQAWLDQNKEEKP